MQPMTPSESPELRVALVGKTGAGKSATGNTILHSNHFPSEVSSSPVTRQSRRGSAVIENTRLIVTDTPDLLSEPSETKTEIEKCVSLCGAAGVHAFLFILTISTFTRQELDLLSRFEQIFGEDVFRFTVVIFTHGDKLGNIPVDRLIRGNFQVLNLINRCGRRYHIINNHDLPNRQQVTELLQKIDSMVSDNGNRCYTLEMLREAERRAQLQSERSLEEQSREREREERERQINLDRVRTETEECVRKEMQDELDKIRAEMEACHEACKKQIVEEMKRDAEMKIRKELQQELKQESMELTDTKKKIKLWSVLQLNYLCVFFFSVAGGCMQSKGTFDTSTFFSGCVVGGSAALLGAVTGKVWVLMLNSQFRMSCLSPQRCPPIHNQWLKKVGVLCGGVLGSVWGYRIAEDPPLKLLAGLGGAVAAFISNHRSY